MPAKPSQPASPPPAGPAAAEPAVVETTETVEQPPPADTSGWYRNRALVPLLVQPTGYPSTELAPGGATWLPADPQHPDLEPCDAPAPVPADADTKE